MMKDGIDWVFRKKGQVKGFNTVCISDKYDAMEDQPEEVDLFPTFDGADLFWMILNNITLVKAKIPRLLLFRKRKMSMIAMMVQLQRSRNGDINKVRSMIRFRR